MEKAITPGKVAKKCGRCLFLVVTFMNSSKRISHEMIRSNFIISGASIIVAFDVGDTVAVKPAEGLLDPNAVVCPVFLFHQYVFLDALSITAVQGSLSSGAKGVSYFPDIFDFSSLPGEVLTADGVNVGELICF